MARREGGGKIRTGTRSATVGSADGRARRGTTAIRNGTGGEEEEGKERRRDGRMDGQPCHSLHSQATHQPDLLPFEASALGKAFQEGR